MPPSDLSTNQTLKVPESEAGTVPNSTPDDRKIYLGVTSQFPPTYGGFHVEEGTQVSIYGTHAAKKQFFGDPLAVATAKSALNEAQKQNWDYLKNDGHTTFLSDQPRRSTPNLPWDQHAAGTAAIVAAHATLFAQKTGKSKFEVVLNPTDAWKKEAGVSAVSRTQLEQRRVRFPQWLRPLTVPTEAGSSRQPPSQGPSNHVASGAGDSIITGQQ
jgi:hypothetical protein